MAYLQSHAADRPKCNGSHRHSRYSPHTWGFENDMAGYHPAKIPFNMPTPTRYSNAAPRPGVFSCSSNLHATSPRKLQSGTDRPVAASPSMAHKPPNQDGQCPWRRPKPPLHKRPPYHESSTTPRASAQPVNRPARRSDYRRCRTPKHLRSSLSSLRPHGAGDHKKRHPRVSTHSPSAARIAKKRWRVPRKDVGQTVIDQVTSPLAQEPTRGFATKRLISAEDR